MVIAVGTCAHPLKAEAEEWARGIQDIYDAGDEDSDGLGRQAAEFVRSLVAKEPVVKAGDTVIFPWTAGREVQIDDTGDRYLIMREADLLAVLEDV